MFVMNTAALPWMALTTGFVGRLAGCPIAPRFRGRDRAHLHLTRDNVTVDRFAGNKGNGRHDRVSPPAETCQHLHSGCLVSRFTENLVIEADNGIGAEDGSGAPRCGGSDCAGLFDSHAA